MILDDGHSQYKSTVEQEKNIYFLVYVRFAIIDHDLLVAYVSSEHSDNWLIFAWLESHVNDNCNLNRITKKILCPLYYFNSFSDLVHTARLSLLAFRMFEEEHLSR